MAELQDFQFDLDGYVFGLGCPVLLEDEGFDTGSITWRTQDAANAQSDGMSFGRDFVDPPSWSWSLGTDAEDEATALQTLNAFAAAWRRDKMRSTPGAVSTLRYRVAGRTRRVYGRPRRFAAPPTNRILAGWVPITVDFQRADDLTYADVERSASIGITPSAEGGLTVPLREPLSTVRSGAETARQINVEGDAPTWAIVTFTGPVSNPYIKIGDWHCGLRGTLAQGERITVDSRPWVRSVLRADGSSLGGRLDRHTYLDQMRLTPGLHTITFGGGASVATSTATVRWRSASYAL